MYKTNCLQKKLGYFLMVTFLLLSPLVAKAEISDNELRKLFIISGILPEQLNGVEYGGIVLFKYYFDHNKTACDFKAKYPNTTVFIDQEGGSVVRIPDAAPPSPIMANKMSSSNFYNAVKLSAKKLKLACIDVNMAPVVEIAPEYGNARSYGKISTEVIEKATIFSNAMQSENIKTVLKHFPGWKNNCVSIHDLNHIKLKIKNGSEALECSITTDSDKFTENMNVFKKIPSNAWMVGNNIYKELSPYPSSMNSEMSDIIRNKLSYKGLVISDALWEIEASPKAIILALQVNDLVMVGFPTQVEFALPIIKLAIQKGILSENQLKEKLIRISNFKKS